MVHIIKVFFQGENKEKQIRRLAVSSDIVGKFDLLLWKIRELFPLLENKQIEITWKDPENDIIHMSSDDELAQALANAEDGLLKIYIYISNDAEMKKDEIPNAKSIHNDLHPHVICDGCDKLITGYRYKCLQCRNFDLCSNCNAADKHPNHDMMKLTKPTHIPREWVFLGARKMWKSMFGRCPSSYFHHCQQQGKHQSAEGSPQATNTDDGKSQWHKVVDDLMKGDFVPAEKLLKENLGSFLNFVESVAGGVDVKIENPPFEPAFCSKKTEASADVSQTSNESSSPKHNADLSNEKNYLSHALEKDINQSSKPVEKSTISTSNDVKVAVKLVDIDATGADKIHAAEKQVPPPSTPNGLFSYADTSVNADGWTLLSAHNDEPEKNGNYEAHNDELEKNSNYDVHNNVPEKNCNYGEAELGDTGVKPKATGLYPEIHESVKSSQTSLEKPNSFVPVEETMPKVHCRMTEDPIILNALSKMQAMGFTNEGGWLERLLIAKKGNINEALDSLYPNTRRR